MFSFIKKFFKISDIAQFFFYFILCVFILLGGFWIDLGIITLIMLHKFGKIFA